MLVPALVAVDEDEAQGPVGGRLRADLHDAQVPAVVLQHQAGPHSVAWKSRQGRCRVTVELVWLTAANVYSAGFESRLQQARGTARA